MALLYLGDWLRLEVERVFRIDDKRGVVRVVGRVLGDAEARQLDLVGPTLIVVSALQTRDRNRGQVLRPRHLAGEVLADELGLHHGLQKVLRDAEATAALLVEDHAHDTVLVEGHREIDRLSDGPVGL